MDDQIITDRIRHADAIAALLLAVAHRCHDTATIARRHADC